MYKILFYFGSHQMNPLWLTLVVVSLLLMAMAQSYASAKKMKLGPALVLSLVVLIVGNAITYFIYDALFADRYGPDYVFEHISIYSYGFMLMVAFVVGTLWLIVNGRKEDPRIEADTILDLMVFVIIGSILGARGLYVLLNLESYEGHMQDILRITEGGLAIHGGIGGALLFGWLYCRAKGLNYFRMTDFFMPAVALGQFIGRIGCFLNGCCYGRACGEDFPLGVTYPNAQTWVDKGMPADLAQLYDAGHAAADQFARHPIQLYEAFGCLLIFFYLTSFRKNKVFTGHVFLMYIWLYSILRFIVENFRYISGDDITSGSSVMLWHTITQAQLASIILAVLAMLLMIDLKRRTLFSKMIEKKDDGAALAAKEAPVVKEEAVETTEEVVEDEDEDEDDGELIDIDDE